MEPSLRVQRAPIAQLRDLNEQYAGWIQEQLKSHPNDLWIDGAEDYIQHARTLLREASGTSDAAQPAAASVLPNSLNGLNAGPVASSPGWASSLLPSDQQGPAVPQLSVPAGSVFSRLGPGPGSSWLAVPALPPSLFTLPSSDAPLAQPASKARPFSFMNGNNASAAASSSAPQAHPSFLASPQAAPAAAVPETSLFTFPAITSNGGALAWGSAAGGSNSSITPAAYGEGAGAEDEEEEAPREFKAEVQLAEGAKLLFKEPAKLFIRNVAKNTWDDRGQGTLTVRQQEEDGAGPLTQVVFTMESGRILINSAVYKGIKPQLAKKPSMVMVNLTLASDIEKEEKQDATLHATLIKFGRAEKATSFISTVETVAAQK